MQPNITKKKEKKDEISELFEKKGKEKTKEKKEVPKNKSAKDEISDIFQQTTTKKKRKEIETKNDEKKTQEPPKKKKKDRKVYEGLKVYTMDELKIGQGGNTDLCPFDCDCCF
jgi:hypothetical protein